MMKGFFCISLLCTFIFLPLSAQAQTQMTEVTALTFGKFSLRDNDSAHDLTVSAVDNSVSAAPEFVIDISPERGEYFLEGFDPGTEVTITVDNGGLTLNGGGGTEVFAIINYTVSPNPITLNGSGEGTFYVGATLRSLGNGVSYDSGSYEDDLDITFDWIP